MNLEERLKYAEMKARHEYKLRPWYKKWWGIIILVIISLLLVLLIASSLYVINKVREIRTGTSPALTSTQIHTYLSEINGDGSNYFLGTNTPQVTIVEFGDFTCQHCKEASPVVNQLAKTYKNKIKIIWRDYLLNKGSIALAMTARCAGEQGKFWPMHNALFAHQAELITDNSSRPAKLVTLAKNLRLNITQFNSCMSSERYLKQIKKDYNDANALKISGTPTWFVNNYAFSGYVPFNKFNTLIQGLIK